MKKLLQSLLLLALCATASAQYIPDDPAFRVGRLENGLTYYLYHNENPAGVAEFYIIHNVGALQEEDNQDGLAHFLEHMAFNGTKHYPGKALLNYLARDGVRFGYNVNAYTGRYETVYNISAVPLARESFVDSVLLILHDWSCDISCEQADLDAERGVISEEWRLRDEPRYRMMCRQTELVYKGAKHPRRTVIGSYDVINGFKRQEILDFYHKWYRPDLQAIAIVGDIDLDEMEARVRAKFADIPAAVNPTPKDPCIPPAQPEAMFADQTDPQIRYQAVKLIYKNRFADVETRHREEYIRDFFARQIVTSVLSDRFREATRQEGSPAKSAVAVSAGSPPDFNLLMCTITPRERTQLAAATELALREVNRLLQHGISPEEFEVARLNVCQRYHLNRERNPEEIRSGDLVKVVIENYLRNYPLLNPVDEDALKKRILFSLTPEEVAAYPARMIADAEAIYSNCYNQVDDPDVPIPEADFRAMVARAAETPLEPAFLSYPKLDLSYALERGRIVSEAKDAKGNTLWILSNGIKVYYRQSEPYKSATRLALTLRYSSGYGVFDENAVTADRYAAGYITRSLSFRKIDKASQRNYPEMLGVSLQAHLTSEGAELSMSTVADRAENGFKALCLQLVDPWFGTPAQLNKYKKNSLEGFAKPQRNRDKFDDHFREAIYPGNPWSAKTDSAAVNAVTPERLRTVFDRSFSGTPELFLCSDLDPAQIRTWVERYIAALPVTEPAPKGALHPLREAFAGREELRESYPPISAPLTDINIQFRTPARKDTKTRMTFAILDYLMSERYIALIREERGGAYHVGFSTELYDAPDRDPVSTVAFQTRPEMEEILLKDVEEEIARMAATGPTSAELDAARKYLIKREKEMRPRIAASAGIQLSQLERYSRYGVDYGYDYARVVKSVKAKDVRKLARKIGVNGELFAIYTEK